MSVIICLEEYRDVINVQESVVKMLQNPRIPTGIRQQSTDLYKVLIAITTNIDIPFSSSEDAYQDTFYDD